MAWPTTSRQSRGYGAEHDKIRAELIRTVVTCEECHRHGRTTLGKIADRISPLSRGGTGARSNYQLQCQDCSDAKTLAEKGAAARLKSGVDRSGRPTAADHPWNKGADVR